MPKIPTIKATARITSEVPGVISGSQISPTDNIGTALQPAVNAIVNYAVAEKNLAEKTEAQELYLKSKNEIDIIQQQVSSLSNTEEAQKIATEKLNQLKLDYGSRSSNTRVQKMFDNMFNLDSIERYSKINKSVRDNQITKYTEGWKTRYQQTLSEYDSETNPILKNQKFKKIENLIGEKNWYTKGGEAELEKDLNANRATLVELDVYSALRKNDFVTANNILSDEEKTKYLDPIKRNSLLDKLKKQSDSFQEKNFEQNTYSLAANTPFSNLGKLSDTAIPSSGNKNKDFKNKTKFQSYIKKTQELIDKEGSAEFYTNNDQNLYQLNSVFNQIYGKAMANPTPENIAAASESFDDYAIEANKKYNALNVPEEKRTLLTNAAITNLKQRIEGARGSEQKLRVLNEVKLIYANHLPSIMKQINNKISPNVAFAISVDDPDLKLSSLQGPITEKDNLIFKQKIKGTMDAPKIEIGKTVLDELEPFSKIISNQPRAKVNSSEIINPIISNITTAVVRKVIDSNESLSSTDITKIAKDFTKKFMSDYDLTNDTYWIPNKIGNNFVNQNFIEGKLEVFKTSLKYNQIDFSKIKIKPVGDGEKYLSEKETLEFFKKNGEFYLNKNDELYFGVKDNNGQPRKFMYSTITEKGKEQYKPLVVKFLDNSANIGGFHDLDMELIYDYMIISDPNLPEEALSG